MKSKKHFILSAVILFCLSITMFLHAQTVTKLWETSGMDTPESILLDVSHSRLFVSNIGGTDPTAKDNNGFISLLDTEGKILSLKWATGLHAPKGMGFIDGLLVVTDIDRLVFIDTVTGTTDLILPIAEAVFLNDIVVTPAGDVIVSDSRASCYYRVKKGVAEKFLCDTSFGFPNGLCLYKDGVLSGVGDKVIFINPNKGSYIDWINESGGVDGLSVVSDEVFLKTDWAGNIHLLYKNKPKSLLLSTIDQKINAADIDYNMAEGILYVPTFFANSVSCYKVNIE